MSFFPSLQPRIKDRYDTKRITQNEYNKSDTTKKLPSLTPIAYYPTKVVRGLKRENVNIQNFEKNINATCNISPICAYTGNIIFQNTHGNSSSNITATSANISSSFINAFKSSNIHTSIDLSYLENYQGNLVCDLPNMMVSLGYKYDSNISNYDKYTKTNGGNIYLEKNTSPSITQDQYNACQTVLSRTRMYDVSKLVQGGAFYGLEDIFKQLKSLRMILLVVLLLSIYFLVQGTLGSADLGFNIANFISSRSSPSTSFLMGAFIGILVPAILSAYMAKEQIKKTNDRFGTIDVSNTPYGEKVQTDKKQESNDITLVIALIVIAYICVMIIYNTMRSKSTSPLIKIATCAIIFLILTVVLFLLFYWAPIVSYANDESVDRAYTINRPLKVWLKGDDMYDVSSVTSNAYVDRYLRRYFAIYALVALSVTILYLCKSNKPIMGFGGGALEGLMASCAIVALPILWIFNWFIGIKFFIGYPMVLMMFRFMRYPLYTMLRWYYLGNPELQSKLPQMRGEFEKPESYTAPWDLIGITIFKYILKFNGNKALYSELFVDPRDGVKDISGNSYVIGHFMRMGMKSTSGPFDVYHHALTFAITLLVFVFIVYGVIGKENAL